MARGEDAGLIFMDEVYLRGFLSRSSLTAKRSEIRELLKVIARPEVISLAGGLPAPETFPVEGLADLLPSIVKREGAAAFQYGATEGDMGLREELAKLIALDGLDGIGPERIVITTASQQGLDLCGRVFITPGDTVVCGLPSYLGALGAFSACGARLSGVPLDGDGIRPDLIEERLVDLRRSGVRPKFLYVVPDFQNPAGVTLSLERRREILEIAGQFDLLVIEDSPYRQLRYHGEHIPSLKAFDREGRVISLLTFSKILFPGLRLGWIVAEPEIIDRIVVAKQPVDLCTSPFNQCLAREYLRTGALPGQIERTRKIYREKLEAILAALEKEIDRSWGVRWTRPEGGLFLWMQLPPGLDASKLLEKALERNVAFVIGSAFHCDEGGSNALRLNFSYPSVEQLRTGAARLAEAIGALLEEHPVPGDWEVAEGFVGAEELSDGRRNLEQLSLNLALTEVVA